MAKCNPQIYKHGVHVGTLVMTAAQAEEHVAKLNADMPDYVHDWHNVAGRKILKRLPKNQVWTQEAPSEPGDYWLWVEGEGVHHQFLHRHQHSRLLGYSRRISQWSPTYRFRTTEDMKILGYWFMGPITPPDAPEIDA